MNTKGNRIHTKRIGKQSLRLETQGKGTIKVWQHIRVFFTTCTFDRFAHLCSSSATDWFPSTTRESKDADDDDNDEAEIKEERKKTVFSGKTSFSLNICKCDVIFFQEGVENLAWCQTSTFPILRYISTIRICIQILGCIESNDSACLVINHFW